MGKNERKGRKQHQNIRQFKLGNYLVLTDTKETEKNYLMGFHKSMPDELKNHLRIEVLKTPTY